MSHVACCLLYAVQAAVASSFNGRPPFADLRFAVYTNAPAQYALFEKGVEPRLTQLKCARRNAADDVQQATLQQATLQQATLQQATLQPATLQPATLQPATLQPAMLQQATLQQAMLQQALIESPDGAAVQKDADALATTDSHASRAHTTRRPARGLERILWQGELLCDRWEMARGRQRRRCAELRERRETRAVVRRAFVPLRCVATQLECCITVQRAVAPTVQHDAAQCAMRAF
jgi:hypothetical protein